MLHQPVVSTASQTDSRYTQRFVIPTPRFPLPSSADFHAHVPLTLTTPFRASRSTASSLCLVYSLSWTTAENTILHPFAFRPPRSFTGGTGSLAYGTTCSASWLPNVIMWSILRKCSWSALVAGIIWLNDIVDRSAENQGQMIDLVRRGVDGVCRRSSLLGAFRRAMLAKSSSYSGLVNVQKVGCRDKCRSEKRVGSAIDVDFVPATVLSRGEGR